MPTFYEIAENARRRNQRNLTPGADINYQYGPFGAKGQNTAPVGMGQHMIEPDYYTPPGTSNNQMWFANEDPSQQFDSFQAAMDFTGGDPEMERKVAMYNADAAQKKQDANRKVAMELMNQQRLRENAMRGMAETRRRDQIKFNQETYLRRDTEKRRQDSSDRTALISAAQYERDPRKRQQLRNMLMQSGGTSADAARFNALTSNRDYYDKNYNRNEEEQQQRSDFTFAANALKAGARQGWDELGYDSSTFSSRQRAALGMYSRTYDTQANSFDNQAKQITRGVRAFNDNINNLQDTEFNRANDPNFIFDQSKIDDLEIAKAKYIQAAKDGGYITDGSTEGNIQSAWTPELKPRWGNVFDQNNQTTQSGGGNYVVPGKIYEDNLKNAQYEYSQAQNNLRLAGLADEKNNKASAQDARGLKYRLEQQAHHAMTNPGNSVHRQRAGGDPTRLPVSVDSPEFFEYYSREVGEEKARQEIDQYNVDMLADFYAGKYDRSETTLVGESELRRAEKNLKKAREGYFKGRADDAAAAAASPPTPASATGPSPEASSLNVADTGFANPYVEGRTTITKSQAIQRIMSRMMEIMQAGGDDSSRESAKRMATAEVYRNYNVRDY
jgi:hypothetical protein